jgi:hypothetical protein
LGQLKCNVVEDPWPSCDRGVKHKLRCDITADFKRVGKRLQQAELERNNEMLLQQVDELSKVLAAAQEREVEQKAFENHLSRQLDERNQMAGFTSTPHSAQKGSWESVERCLAATACRRDRRPVGTKQTDNLPFHSEGRQFIFFTIGSHSLSLSTHFLDQKGLLLNELQ